MQGSSIEGDRSYDPDHEPRKEGSGVPGKQLKVKPMYPMPNNLKIGGNKNILKVVNKLPSMSPEQRHMGQQLQMMQNPNVQLVNPN